VEEPLQLAPADAAAWRRWLEANHQREAGVWLVLARGGAGGLRHPEALEEALAFGWIDGQGRRGDDSTWRIRFTPRRRASRWSKRNTEIVERLTAAGRMHPAGLAEVERAKADGRWAAAYAGPATIEVPEDLAAALNASRRAQASFGRLTAQNRYAILFRLHAIKRPEARARRLAEYVAMLERGETIHPQRRSLS
jgi:uncharacterized protein YdeI (YjbR/CyaY-like superfamily)